MNAIANTRESFEDWYHPNFYTDPKTLAWEAWKQSRKDTLEETAKLQTERDEYRHGSELEMNSAIKFCQERNAARIERDALAADAERYRFISAHIADEGDMDVLERAFEPMDGSETCTLAEFNACIDAAIVKEQLQAGVQ